MYWNVHCEVLNKIQDKQSTKSYGRMPNDPIVMKSTIKGNTNAILKLVNGDYFILS